MVSRSHSSSSSWFWRRRVATRGARGRSWLARLPLARSSVSSSGSLLPGFTASSRAASPPRYAGIYAIGFGLAAFGVADVTFGNGLIAAFVFGITLGLFDHEITERFSEFSENVSAIFQVVTFFVFGALIVVTGYGASVPALIAFIAFALLIARPVAVEMALFRTGIPRPHKAFIAWFGPKGVASMLFALLVLDSTVATQDDDLRRGVVRDSGFDPRPRPHGYGRGTMDRAEDEGDVTRSRVDLDRIEVGDTRPDEVAAAVAVAARAMSTSPMAVAVLGPDQERCRYHLHRFFTRLYKLAANQRPLVARLDGRVIASTNDLVGGACRARPVDKLRSLPALALAGPRSAIRAAKWFENWEHRDPDGPHAHYGPFGVEPELQGQGVGSLVMREYVRRLDERSEASYLETEKPQNVALYQRFGFEVIEEAEVLGVPNWFMWREPGAHGPALRH